MTVRTVTVELGGGRVLTASRFRDPTTGRDVLTLAEGWPEDGSTPGRRGEAVEVPGSSLPEVVEAIEALEEGEA